MFENFGIFVLSSVLTRSVFSPSFGLTNVVIFTLPILTFVLVNEIASVSFIDLILYVEVTGELVPVCTTRHSAFSGNVLFKVFFKLSMMVSPFLP